MLPHQIAIQSVPGPLLKAFVSSRNDTAICVLMDEQTKVHCYPLIEYVLPPHSTIVLAAGEEQKNLDSCVLIWQKLTDIGFDRHSLLVGLGGGVIGDMGGFCAATFKRGVPFLLLPTTLLAQADASVGGKTGIDFQYYKNHIGVFREPAGTLIATDFLKTLPVRELRSGFAEIIKHCIIGDKAMWEKIATRSLGAQQWEELIPHSVGFKTDVTGQDPTEKGLRKILNFGHTIGHALESFLLAGQNRIYHGEAIAAGMIAESWIASSKGYLNSSDLSSISGYITGIFGKIPMPSTDDLLPLITQDKKNRGEQILMALPKGIGKAGWDIPVTRDEIKDSLAYYSSC